jgi:hypothetical protein
MLISARICDICGKNVGDAPKLPDENSMIGKVRRMRCDHVLSLGRADPSLLISFCLLFCGLGFAPDASDRFGMAIA